MLDAPAVRSQELGEKDRFRGYHSKFKIGIDIAHRA